MGASFKNLVSGDNDDGGAPCDDAAALEQHIRGGGAPPGHAVIRGQQDCLLDRGARAGARALGGGGGRAGDAELEH